jgi:hypothetical protein
MYAQESRLKDGTFGTIAVHGGYVFQTSAVLQTDGLPQAPPALKGGVTLTIAFQASYVFQTGNERHKKGAVACPLRFCNSPLLFIC